MALFIPTWWGDVELNALSPEGGVVLTYQKCTPEEKKAIKSLMAGQKDGTVEGDFDPKKGGTLTFTHATLAELGPQMAMLLHMNSQVLTGIKFTTGPEKVQVIEGQPTAEQIADPETDKVVVARPPRHCPIPEFTRMKEERAAAVLRRFLDKFQKRQFDSDRSFIVYGADTHHAYQVTSRWHKEIRRMGVLRDLDSGEDICCYNPNVPPSEECLSLMLAVIGPETAFLNSWKPVTA